jgi:hypothetical protein
VNDYLSSFSSLSYLSLLFGASSSSLLLSLQTFFSLAGCPASVSFLHIARIHTSICLLLPYMHFFISNWPQRDGKGRFELVILYALTKAFMTP